MCAPAPKLALSGCAVFHARAFVVGVKCGYRFPVVKVIDIGFSWMSILRIVGS